MTDMQKNIRTLLKEGTQKKAVLLYIFAAVIVLTEMIMYYAASLTLNTLFAGIGNMYISLIALACAFGAAAGVVLFTCIAGTLRRETEERCLETLEDVLIHEEESEEMLYPYIEEAVHFQMNGIVQSRQLLIQDVIRIIAVTALDYRCGLILAAGFIVYEFLFKRMAEKKITDIKRFVRELHLIPGLMLTVLLCAVLVFALYEMEKGRAGLYGVFMILFMFMDLIRAHVKQTDSIASLRKDLRSIEILDAYLNDAEQVPEHTDTKTVCSEPKPYVMLGISFLVLTCGVIMYVSAVRNILGYRAQFSTITACALMCVSALFAALCHSYGKGAAAGMKVNVMMRKAASACVSVIALIYAFTVNALLGGILASAFAAEQILLPLIAERYAHNESGSTDHIRGLIHMVCLSLIIIAGVLLYWNAMASFTDVLTVSVLYMVTYMHIDTLPSGFAKGDKADEQ